MTATTSLLLEARDPLESPGASATTLVRTIDLLASPQRGGPGEVEIESIARIDPSLAERVSALHPGVAPAQGALFAALSRDPALKSRFLEDPISVFQQTTSAPPALVQQLRSVAEDMTRQAIAPLSPADEAPSAAAAAEAKGSTRDLVSGWDLVAAARFREVNAALAKAQGEGRLPSAFRWPLVVKFGNTECTVAMSGVFAPLAFTGGTGRDAEVTLAVASGTVVGLGDAPVDVRGMKIVLTIDLEQTTGRVASNGDARCDLLIDIARSETWKGVSLADVPAAMSALDASSLMAAIKGYLKSDLTGKSYVVASVDMGNAKDPHPFLRPTAVDYALATDLAHIDDSTLAIQLLTTGQRRGKSVLVNGTIPEGARASFLIANPLFMKNVMLPAAAKGFGVPESTFEAKAAGETVSIENRKSFVLKGVEHDPEVETLVVEVLDGAFDFVVKGKADVSPGIQVTFHSHARYGFHVGSGENPSIELEELLFETSHKTKIEWWVWLVTAGAAAIALPFVGIVVAALAPIIVAIVKAAVQGATPDLSASLFTTVVQPVRWTGLGTLVISKVQIPAPVQMVGHLA